MLPSIHVFGIHIPSYALMLGIGIASFLLLFLYQFRDLYRRDRVTFNRLLFVTLLSVVALGVSAAFFNSLFHSIEEKKLVIGGITWLGGVVGAIATFLVLTHYLVPKKRGYTFETLSAMMPGMALAHAFGRVGCFLGGCCYGRVSNSPLAVVYPANSSAAKLYPNADATGSLPVLPIPLFEAVFELLLFAALFYLVKKKKAYGPSLYAVAYGAFRFVCEYFRGDSRGSVGGFLTPSQLLSLVLIAFGVVIFLEMRGIAFKKWHEKRLLSKETADRLPIVSLDASSDATKLRALHELFKEGVITEAEYEAKKKEILERM